MTARYDGASAIEQGTLRTSIGCAGTGLHGGQRISMTLHPAAPNTGIVFRRTDARGALIPASWRRVIDTRLCSVIANDDGVRVGTIEHLMAALAGAGIDNLRIDIDGPEVPAMDGSAAPFTQMIERAGVVRQGAVRRAIQVLKPVSVSDGAARAELEPAEIFTVSCEIDFDNPAVNRQARTVTLMNGAFKSELCRARTFGFEHEVEQLRKMGLAKGGSLDNAIVIGRDRILNEGGLRYTDEFVRHKILDCVGDLYLAGGPILGHFRGHRSGHALNNQVLKTLFADASAWRYVPMAKRTVRGSKAAPLRLAEAAR
jgi:UDP-3-O-[3-hydroxymyristoyl] N-acetylglucosamine deacetylase